MPNFDYEVLDGASTTRKIRGEDLGLDGSNVQIIGHKIYSDDLGKTTDTVATDETSTGSVIAFLKGLIREVLKLPLRIGGITDTAAVDQTSAGSLIAIAKAQLRELIQISGASGGGYSEGTASSVSVTNTETVIATIDCRGKSRLGITVQNAGGVTLDSFRSKIRTNSSFSFHFPEATDTAAYSTNSSDQTGNATALVRKANGDPTALAGAGYVWIRYNVEAIESLQITATVGTGSTDINAWWLAE